MLIAHTTRIYTDSCTVCDVQEKQSFLQLHAFLQGFYKKYNIMRSSFSEQRFRFHSLSSSAQVLNHLALSRLYFSRQADTSSRQHSICVPCMTLFHGPCISATAYSSIHTISTHHRKRLPSLRQWYVNSEPLLNTQP